MNYLVRATKLQRFNLRDQQIRSFFRKRSGGGGEGSGVVGVGATSTSGQRNINVAENLDEPYKYFGSSAEKIRATPEPPPTAKYTPIIVNLSLVVFMIYFCILREENDTDEILGRNLFDHFGDEASRLKKAYDYNIKNNLPTHEIVSRLREIGAPVPPNMR